MKFIYLLLILCFSQGIFCQFNKNAVFTSSVNFQLGKGLGQDDAGFGLALDAAVRGTKKFQPLMEGTVDRFIGNKVYYAGPGKIYKPFIYGIRAGGRYFFSPRVSLSMLYGVIWHTLDHFDVKSSSSFKGILSLYAGSSKKIVFRGFYYRSPQPNIDIRCYGVGAGFRF